MYEWAKIELNRPAVNPDRLGLHLTSKDAFQFFIDPAPELPISLWIAMRFEAVRNSKPGTCIQRMRRRNA